MSNGVINFISMGKSRVLYISYDGLTDPLGQSQVLPYLSQLSRLNYEITVLSVEKEDNFFKSKDEIKKICSDSSIKWECITYTKTPPVLSTMKDVSKLKKKARALYKSHTFNIVHCRSYVAALVGLFLKKRFGVKMIFDMRGFWADERVDGGLWNLKVPIFKWVYNFFKRKEKMYLLKADATISLTYNGKNEICSWSYYSRDPDDITVIPCCADLSHFDFRKSYNLDKTKSDLGIPVDNVVICYLGSIGTWYMMEEMLDYFKLHLVKFPNSTFLWITKDDPKQILKEATERDIVDYIKILPTERTELPNILSIVDASIFFIKPLFSKKASSPTKMAELLGMGIPLICNSNVGDTDEIVKKEKVGVVVDMFNIQAYDQAINSFNGLMKTPKEKLRDVAQKYFSLEGGVEKYEEVYKKLS